MHVYNKGIFRHERSKKYIPPSHLRKLLDDVFHSNKGVKQERKAKDIQQRIPNIGDKTLQADGEQKS